MASRHRAGSSTVSSTVSPEWSLLICNDLNSAAGFLFFLLSHSKERLNHLDRDLELSRHPYSSGIQNPEITHSSGLFLFKEKNPETTYVISLGEVYFY